MKTSCVQELLDLMMYMNIDEINKVFSMKVRKDKNYFRCEFVMKEACWIKKIEKEINVLLVFDIILKTIPFDPRVFPLYFIS